MRNVRLFFFAALVTSCDEPADDEVLRLIDDVVVIGNDNVAIVCDCWDEAGFESRSQCLDDQILPAQRRCVEDAYLRDAEASKLFLSCVTPLMRELGDCLDARLSCDDPDLVDACFEDYDLGRESCIDPPLSVQRALDDCSVGGGDTGAPGDTGDAPPPPPPDGGDDTGGDDPPPPPPPDGGSDTGGGSGPAPP